MAISLDDDNKLLIHNLRYQDDIGCDSAPQPTRACESHSSETVPAKTDGIHLGDPSVEDVFKWYIRDLCDSDHVLPADGKDDDFGFAEIMYLDFGYKKELRALNDPTDASSNDGVRLKVQMFLKDQKFRITSCTDPDVIRDWQLEGVLRDEQRDVPTRSCAPAQQTDQNSQLIEG